MSTATPAPSKTSASELILGWEIQADGTPIYRLPKDVPKDPPLTNIVIVAAKGHGASHDHRRAVRIQEVVFSRPPDRGIGPKDARPRHRP